MAQTKAQIVSKLRAMFPARRQLNVSAAETGAAFILEILFTSADVLMCADIIV